MHTGLVSITFRSLSARDVVDLVAEAGLDGIEWGGDVHAPHGDVSAAREVAAMTREAGLRVLAYGSYYRVGHTTDVPFDRVIDSARALGAEVVRIWAGKGPFNEMTEADHERVVDETQQLADRAAEAGLTLAFEYHRGTLTETADSARRLLTDIDRANVKTLWQPDPRLSVDQNDAALRTVLPWLINLHVFSWQSDGTRLPLADGESAWRRYFQSARQAGDSAAALIEFVQNDAPDQFRQDAQTLRQWMAAL